MAVFRRSAPVGPVPPGVAVAAAADSVSSAGGNAVYPEPFALISAAVLIVIGGVAGTYALDHWGSGVTFHPPKGVGVFALFYILAQVVERVQEPFAPFIRGSVTSGPGGVNQLKAKARLEDLVASATATEQQVADAKRTLDQVRSNMTVILFGGASIISMVAAGYTKALLLLTVGVSGVAPWFDVVITGLAVAGGTKALHDLLSNVRESKDEKQDKTESS